MRYDRTDWNISLQKLTKMCKCKTNSCRLIQIHCVIPFAIFNCFVFTVMFFSLNTHMHTLYWLNLIRSFVPNQKLRKLKISKFNSKHMQSPEYKVHYVWKLHSHYRTSGRGWNSLKLSRYMRNCSIQIQVKWESAPSWCYGRVSKSRMHQRDASMLQQF